MSSSTSTSSPSTSLYSEDFLCPPLEQKLNWRSVEEDILENTKTFFSQYPHITDDHGYKHALIVYQNVMDALKGDEDFRKEILPITQCILRMAALLHDVDDHKLFKKTKMENVSLSSLPPLFSSYPNAHSLLSSSSMPSLLHSPIITLISLVSTSHNGNSIPTHLPLYSLLPRDADRLEAVGEIGVVRCLVYTIICGRRITEENTVNIINDEELNTKIDIKTRYELYGQRGKNSNPWPYPDTMIDHFYDKLLSLGKGQSGNQWIENQFEERHKMMKEWMYKVNQIRRESKNGEKEAETWVRQWGKEKVGQYVTIEKDSELEKWLTK